MQKIHLLTLVLTGFLVSCTRDIKPTTIHFVAKEKAAKPLKDTSKYMLSERFNTPLNTVRVKLAENSFGFYLQRLPLKKEGSTVSYYNGDTKVNRGVYCAVVDMPIGNKNLHQCADAVMRFRAEYLWEQKRFNDIHFNFTNGFRVDYKEWMKGKRIRVKGNDVSWVQRAEASNSYADFWKYMECIFM